jgi:hypothetical protein|tara:strand:- start:482 stop:613 length:132 start_codon:yes stop_codon:yes gene_type:complete
MVPGKTSPNQGDGCILKMQIQRYEKRINVKFGGTQKLNEFKKV